MTEMSARPKVILVACFLLVFGAGTSLGLLLKRSQPPQRHQSWLAGELNLTPEQQEQMKRIWSETREARTRQRAAASQERDQAIAALLTDEQRDRYDAVQKEYARKMDEMSQDAERKRAFDETVQKAKAILTPEQAAKYDDWLKKQRDRGQGGAGAGFHGPRHRDIAPGSRPATQEQSTSRSGQ